MSISNNVKTEQTTVNAIVTTGTMEKKMFLPITILEKQKEVIDGVQISKKYELNKPIFNALISKKQKVGHENLTKIVQILNITIPVYSKKVSTIELYSNNPEFKTWFNAVVEIVTQYRSHYDMSADIKDINEVNKLMTADIGLFNDRKNTNKQTIYNLSSTDNKEVININEELKELTEEKMKETKASIQEQKDELRTMLRKMYNL